MSIGNQCYLFSKEKATWADAHFNCEQINAKLAVVKSKAQDQKLRIFLNGFTGKMHKFFMVRVLTYIFRETGALAWSTVQQQNEKVDMGAKWKSFEI